MELRSPERASSQQPASRPATDAELAWLDVLNELEAALHPPTALDGDAGSDGADGSATATLGEGHEATADAASAPYVGSGMWRSPAQMPPLPESLRARAEALHIAQQLREHEIAAERNQIQRHIDALSSVPRPRSAAASVYLDVAG